MPTDLIGYPEASSLVADYIDPLPPCKVALSECVGHVAAETKEARVDAPSSDISLKDGFAVISDDVAAASRDHPVALKITGTIGAGDDSSLSVSPGSAVRILTGGTLPPGATAVVADEFADEDGHNVRMRTAAATGSNILPRGADVAVGERLIRSGDILTPGRIGRLVAAGHAAVRIHPKPSVALVATGNEMLPPGAPMSAGKVFASNIATMDAWCRRLGMPTRRLMARDDPEDISRALTEAIASADAVLTSGGAWKSRRDWMSRVLDQLGWRKVFHRVRMGPGKAVGFGLLTHKPVFILPGGPPSGVLAFLQVALPGLCQMAGFSRSMLRETQAMLKDPAEGQRDWTQFVFGRVSPTERGNTFFSLKHLSRIQAMAEANAVLTIPEGVARMASGAMATVQLLD